MRTSTLKRIASADAQLETSNDYDLAKKIYSQTMGAKYSVLARYQKHGVECPSELWAIKYLETGGNFDSCGVWGIRPEEGKDLDDSGISPEFTSSIFKLFGRADNFKVETLKNLFVLGLLPKTVREYYMLERGIARKLNAENAGTDNLKSIFRYGWMSQEKFDEHIIAFSKKNCSKNTNIRQFNGIYVQTWDSEKGKNILRNFSNQSSLYKKWVSKRPSPEVREQRVRDRKISECARTERSKPLSIPGHLVAVCLRNKLLTPHEIGDLFSGKYYHVTNGCILQIGDILVSMRNSWDVSNAKNQELLLIKGRTDIAYVCINNIYFIFNPQEGFKNHIEGKTLEDAIYLWDKKARTGKPRPLCLNDVRNDRTGTAGFCFSGTKRFLEDKMPFVYNLVKDYNSWSDIPESIMSTKWELVDWNIFNGYPAP